MDEPLQPSRKPLGFWKTVLATFVGGLTASIVFSVLAFFFLVSLLIGSLLSQSAPKTIEENSVLKINLSSISELVTADPWSTFLPSRGEG